MTHQWVKNRNRVSREYILGIREFISVAEKRLDSRGRTLCPCRNCINARLQEMSVVKSHLMNVGIDMSYTKWVHHGEDEVIEEDMGSDDLGGGLRAALEDATGHPMFNIGSINDLTENQCRSNKDNRYDKLNEALHDPLYEGSTNISTLTFVVKLMHLKVSNKWTDKSFDSLLKLLHEILPDSNNCPESYYGVRTLLLNAGLGYEVIDVCQYDCAIFYGDYKFDITCPVCGSNRYVRNKVPYKKLRYFPISPRLKRLYASRHTAKDMRWHKEVREDEPGVLRHPADGKAWKHFDSLYPKFADDPRSVRMGLSSDGFNPFGNMTTSYSMWPVILMPYNMPPWYTMHKSNYLLSLLIPGPKSPGKDFDVFLRPLVDELKLLWSEGVDAYDSYTKSDFRLYASVIWTISDFPAYAYLSGWSTMGKLACPVCLEDTRSSRIRGKLCYTGHRCFLSKSHKWRKSLQFNGKQENNERPRQFTGDDILRQVDEIPKRTSGKSPTNQDRKRKRGIIELNWSKKSILFELPYWCKLLIRHCLDVMHIEKNVCDNIVGTLLNDPAKSKDTAKARLDLKDLKIRKDQWLQERNGKFEKPHANFTLTKDECIKFCKFIKSVQLPDGYASNINRCVTEHNTLGGMKTHDCHVLLQKILPVAILPYLDKEIRVTLIEFCQFFQKISSKTLYEKELEEMKSGIVIILCKLEKIFPPAFFTIMVHLCVHLPEEALLGGPVSQRWMFGIERRMGTYKGYVRNYAQPEGSIAEAYVVDEAITFLSPYVDNLESRFNRSERNWDVSIDKYEMEVFNHKVRTLGAGKAGNLRENLNVIFWYIINNCRVELADYLQEHKELLFSRGIREADVDSIQKVEFPSWFRQKMNLFRAEGDSRATDDLYALSQYPDDRYTSWQRCIVQGIRFRCKESDDKYITQCSGVCVGGEEATVMYYGVLVEILELDFILGRKVFIFRCNWYNSDPRGKSMVVDHNLTSIDTKSKWYMQDPFILANQAQQVFYLNDMSRGKNWMVVQKVNHRNIYDVPEHDKDEVIRNDIFQEADSNELRPFKPAEEINETLSIVRHDVTPESLSYDKVEAINKANPPVVDLETNADDDDDFGSVFVNEEPIINSESDHDSDADYEKTDDDDFLP